MKETIKGLKFVGNAIEELNNSFQGKPPTTKEGKRMLKAMNKIIAEKVKEAREDERAYFRNKFSEPLKDKFLKKQENKIRFETAKEIFDKFDQVGFRSELSSKDLKTFNKIKKHFLREKND